MRKCLIAVAMAALALSGCKKSASAPAPEPTPAPTATPAPTPEPTPTPVVIDKTARVIVLCYHRFDSKPKDSLSISPQDFEAQMQALKDQGIEVIPMEDFLAWRRGEKNIPPKAAVVTIDDGYLSGYTTAWPILRKFNYPFTMFIYTDYVKGGPKSGGQSMTWEQLAEMRDAGVDIGSHTVSHTALTGKKGRTPEQYEAWVKDELERSKQILEQKLGIQIKTLAYPYGMHNELVRKIATDAGYEAAFTVYGQHLGFGGDPVMQGRYAIESTKPDVFQKAIAFSAGAAAPAGVEGITAIPASAAMVTIPAEGETVTTAEPEIKANLAALGKVDPKSVVMRVSGLGAVPATYDPATKTVSYKMQQKIRSSEVTVIISATADGRKIETRWTFKYDPTAAPAPQS